MLATIGPVPAVEDDWAYEIKWDGVRAITYIQDGRFHMESRNLADITPRYPEIHPIVAALGGTDAVLDGEVVAFDDHGRPSFGRLQSRMHLTGAAVATRMVEIPAAYLLFDVLFLGGTSTLGLPYVERRRLLESLDLNGPFWRTPSIHSGDGAGLLAVTKDQGLEGIVAKRLQSLYVPGRRSRDWVKVKHRPSQEVVIGGWLEGAGTRAGRLGALLAGYYDDAGLRYAGRVGTGFDDAELRKLGQLLAEKARATSPFVDPVPRHARFIEPALVCEVEFAEWTHTGTMRAPAYKGLRDDKPAGAVRRETR